MSTRVLLADDEAMIRKGLHLILRSERDLEVVGEAATGEEAVELSARLRPDVVLMDIRMPVLDGLAATERILAAQPEVRVVMLTTFNEDDSIRRALGLGASGFLLKVAPPERLVEAVHAVAAGEAYLDPMVTRSVIEAFSEVPHDAAPTPALDQLTPREREVLLLMGRGLSNAEIASDLYLGEATVKTHVARVLQKLGLRDRVQAVVLVHSTGLLRPPAL